MSHAYTDISRASKKLKQHCAAAAVLEDDEDYEEWGMGFVALLAAYDALRAEGVDRAEEVTGFVRQAGAVLEERATVAWLEWGRAILPQTAAREEREAREAEEERIAAERRREEAEAKQREEEERAKEEKRVEEERRAEEEKRVEEERRAEEEKRVEEERRAEEEKRVEEERRAEEEKRVEEERRAEEAQQREGAKRLEDEERGREETARALEASKESEEEVAADSERETADEEVGAAGVIGTTASAGDDEVMEVDGEGANDGGVEEMSRTAEKGKARERAVSSVATTAADRTVNRDEVAVLKRKRQPTANKRRDEALRLRREHGKCDLCRTTKQPECRWTKAHEFRCDRCLERRQACRWNGVGADGKRARTMDTAGAKRTRKANAIEVIELDSDDEPGPSRQPARARPVRAESYEGEARVNQLVRETIADMLTETPTSYLRDRVNSLHTELKAEIVRREEINITISQLSLRLLHAQSVLQERIDGEVEFEDEDVEDAGDDQDGGRE